MTIPTKHRLRYSLRTLFVVVALVAVSLYWPVRVQQAHRAREAYVMAQLLRDCEMNTNEDLCEASLKRYRAECAVPFADHDEAAAAHFERIARAWNISYGPASDWRMGISGTADLAEAIAKRDKIRAYYDEAARMAGVEP